MDVADAEDPRARRGRVAESAEPRQAEACDRGRVGAVVEHAEDWTVESAAGLGDDQGVPAGADEDEWGRGHGMLIG